MKELGPLIMKFLSRHVGYCVLYLILYLGLEVKVLL